MRFKVTARGLVSTALLGVAVASTGVGVGLLWQAMIARYSTPLVVDFDTKPFANGILQGDAAQVRCLLQNRSSSDVRLVAVHKSCGCISVTDSTGENLSFPHVLPSNSEVTWVVSLNTDSKGGVTNEPIVVEYEYEGRVNVTTSELSLHICPGPHSLTGPIVLTTTALEGTAIIGDAFPNGGVTFARVDGKSAIVRHATLERIENTSPEAEGVVQTGVPCRPIERYRLHVQGIASIRDAAGYVTLLPENSRIRPVNIPVHFRADASAEKKRSNWILKPTELFVKRMAGSKIVREIRIIPSSNESAEITIEPSSNRISATIRKEEALYVATVIINDSEALASEGEFVTVYSNANQKVGSIPIICVGDVR